MKEEIQKNNLLPLTIVGILFFSIGFSLGINGLLIPYLKKAFSLSNADSYLILTATFSAFLIFGYPSGLIIQKIGYRKSMVLSFMFFAFGLYLFVPSAKTESFVLFLIASFISGAGNTLLQAAVNPYVTICGPVESAAKRISVMIIFNRSGWAIAPIFLALFLDLTQAKIDLSDMFLPFYIIVGVFLLLGLFTWFAPLPEIKAKGEEAVSEESSAIMKFVSTKTNVFQFPHLLLGVLTLFVFIGLDTLTLVSPVDFALSLGLQHPEVYTMHTVIGTVSGCIISIILIPKVISQTLALKWGTASGTVVSLLIVLLPPYIAIHLVAVVGFTISIVWGAVWPLAISHLGKFTKAGSSLLVTAIVGGAVFPLLFGWLKDVFGNIQQAYWLFFPSLLFMMFYAFRGHKIGLKNLLKEVKA
jgi:FHS family L-fucose permease-like MFS transporter